MDEPNTWKISLAAANRAAAASSTDLSASAAAAAWRIEAEHSLSRWLPPTQIAGMKDRDVSVLSTETAALIASASRSRDLWQAFPEIGSFASAQEAADRFSSALEKDRAAGIAARTVCESLGLDWSSAADANVDAAEKTAGRLLSSSAELLRLGRAVENWIGCVPSLQDASFLVSVAASLRVADIPAMAGYTGNRQEIEQAVVKLEEIDRLAAELSSQFGFDPTQHSESAFGGIVRAFSSGRAQDFLSASRKLGITIKGADQAQRAAALLKNYIAALGDMTLSPSGSDTRHNDAVVAKARLAQSIRRRTGVMSIDMKSLTPALADIELLDFSQYPGDDELALNHDTRKLIEDNVSSAPTGATVSELAAELNRRADEIGAWAERQRRGLLFAEPGATHDQIEVLLADNPVPITVGGGLVLRRADDLEALERHIQWLSEAAMLPLSDDQLKGFVAHVAALKP